MSTSTPLSEIFPTEPHPNKMGENCKKDIFFESGLTIEVHFLHAYAANAFAREFVGHAPRLEVALQPFHQFGVIAHHAAQRPTRRLGQGKLGPGS